MDRVNPSFKYKSWDTSATDAVVPQADPDVGRRRVECRWPRRRPSSFPGPDHDVDPTGPDAVTAFSAPRTTQRCGKRHGRSCVGFHLAVADRAGRRAVGDRGDQVVVRGRWATIVRLLVVNALGQTPSTAGNWPVLMALVKAW